MRWNPRDAVAVVTGASSGIGRCLTRRLMLEGANVVAVARRRERLDELKSAEGSADLAGELILVAGDVTQADTRARVAQAAAKLRGGELDLLVNNAGIGAIGRFAEATPQRLRQVMEVNFFAPAELTRELIPLLRRGRAPVICNVGSVLGHCAVPDKSEYCASKFALHGWSDSLRAEMAGEGIQVTLVSPSTTRSEFFDALVETGTDANSTSMGSWSPDRVAARTMAAIKWRRREVILSLGGKGLVYADRMVPPIVAAVLARNATRKQSADGDDAGE